MIFGAIGRVCFGVAADRLGALASYAMASATQTAPLSLCVRNAVPANRFGGALGVVMMVAWAGMAFSSYFSGRLFDATLSYNLSFIVAGVVGILNLLVLALISFRQRKVSQRPVGSRSLKVVVKALRA
jgi:MFS family permease